MSWVSSWVLKVKVVDKAAVRSVCMLAFQMLLMQRTASFPSHVTCVLVVLLQCCWTFFCKAQVRERSVFQKTRASQRLFSRTLFPCGDAHTVAAKEGKSGIFPNRFWLRDWS